ncbi:MAG TPA: M56 family metallopeptidase [Steroidobacteraceae bacterium]
MVLWALYVIAVSALVGAAALCAERAARLRRAPTRWHWLAAILASLMMPILISSVSVQAPAIPGITTARPAARAVALRSVTSIPLSPQGWISDSNARQNNWRSFDSILENVWRFGSAAMLLILLVQAVLLAARKRRWPREQVLSRNVLLSTNVGPAIVGFLRPCVVIPAWVKSAPPQIQRAVIAHEYAHLEARDPLLLTAALFALVLVPWNLPLWWQLHRLRHALEVDCDARVVRSGHDVVLYSETLIAVGERQSAYLGAIAAMSESPSLLEQRIKIMLGEPARWWKVSAALLVCLSLVFVGAAAQVSPPNAPSAGVPQEITLDAATLRRYVGFYKIGEPEIEAVMTVAVSGTQLSTQITGQQSANIYAQTPTHFFPKAVEATIDFVTDGNAPATALTLHQNGRDSTMPRLNDALAIRFNAELAARIQSNTPRAGSERAARDFFAHITHGQPPDYSRMSPEIAALTRQQEPRLVDAVGSLGALQGITFQGVGAGGADAFIVKFLSGALLVHIKLDSRGIINGFALQQPPP